MSCAVRSSVHALHDFRAGIASPFPGDPQAAHRGLTIVGTCRSQQPLQPADFIDSAVTGTSNASVTLLPALPKTE